MLLLLVRLKISVLIMKSIHRSLALPFFSALFSITFLFGFAGVAAAANATTLTVVNPATGVYGGSVTLSATLTQSVGGAPISGKTIIFTLNNVPVGTATTNGSGIATVNAPTLGLISAGTHANYVKALYLGGGGYVGDNGSADLILSKKVLTITGITASNKLYDGNTTATIDVTNAHRSGVVLLDQVNLNTSGAVGTFTDPNPGIGKTVDISGITLTGSAANNYTLGTPQATATANITVACDLNPTPFNFDSFNLGSVNGQGGWGGQTPPGIPINSSLDQAVVTNNIYPTFGCQSLRMSDAYTSDSFGDQIFSPSVANEAGETDALNGGFSGGARQNHFVATFDIGSMLPNAVQPGMHMSVSPDRGDGARMSYLRFEDHSASDVYTDPSVGGEADADHPVGSHYTDGIHVYFDDVQGENVVYQAADFVETDIATLDRTKAHTITFDMTFLDGPSNDIVKVYIDGNLVHTGTSWENYYRFDTESQGYPDVDPSLYNKSRTVDSLLFRESGDNDPANANNGFLIDNVDLASSNIPGTLQIQKYECPAGTTVTRTANGVGSTPPAGCTPESGVGFEYTYDANNDTNNTGPFLGLFGDTTPFTQLALTDANGLSTNPNMPTPGRYIIRESDPSNLLGLYCTGDGGDATTNDNQEITFVAPNANATQCVAYDQAPDVTPPTATFIFPTPGPAATSFQVQFSEPVNQTEATDPANYFLNNWPGAGGSGPLTGNATVAYDSGSNTATVTFTNPGWYVSPEQQWGVQDVQDLAGNTLSPNPTTAYSSPLVAPTAPGTPTTATPTTSTSQNWTWTAATDPTDPTNASGVASYEYQVTDNSNADAIVVGTTTVGNTLGVTTNLPVGSYTLHVEAVDNAGNIGPESTGLLEVDAVTPPTPSTYTVTIDKFVNGAQATADTANSTSFPMIATWDNAGADSGTAGYALSTTPFNSSNAYEAVTENMNPGSSYSTYENNAANECTTAYPFKLVGYSTGTTQEMADNAANITSTVPSFTDLNSNEYVVVWNVTCPPAPQDVSPANNSTLTSAAWTEADWTSVTDPAGPITYIYESATNPATNADGSFVTPVYTSSPLATNSIPTTGTPDGTYYWHARAVDTAGHMGPWGTPFSTTVSESAPETPTAPIITDENLTVNSGTSVTITWTTDHNATSRVVYGTTPVADGSTSSCASPDTTTYNCYGYSFSTNETDTPANTIGVTSHSVTITGLTSGITYYFRPVSEGSPEAAGSELSATPTDSGDGDGGGDGDTSTHTITASAGSNGTIDPLGADVVTDGTDATFTITPNSDFHIDDVLVDSVSQGATSSVTFTANSADHAISATFAADAPADTEPPVITVIGANPAYVQLNMPYSDLGATVTDNIDTGLGYVVSLDGAASTSPASLVLDTSTEGTHTIYFGAEDSAHNKADTKTRTVIVDGTAPTAVITSDSTDPTTDNPIHVTVTFSEPVTGFDQSDLTIGNAGIGNFAESSNTVYTFDLTPTGSDVTAIIQSDTYQDLAGNQNTAESDFEITYSPLLPVPTPTPSSGGGGGGIISGSSAFGFVNTNPTGGGNGVVLGTSTEAVTGDEPLPTGCSALLTEYMRMGKKNDPAQVKLLQTFLNTNLGTTVPVTGFFGTMTTSAVDQFQLKYKDIILTPWGLTQPTGYVYKLTEYEINLNACSTLNAPVPNITNG